LKNILSWKKSQINNGILEGLNLVLQAAKRKAKSKLQVMLGVRKFLIINLNNVKLLIYTTQSM